ncbi:DoxX family protein [Aridibaculum aurantiacum]|uniref:DoxX family protein n=1 Tax=Aridibaculum aurantiacum TaxID=2810307 RepID=UPI001A969EE0|nr:DoxX family protein [Aridibaculum aurantiacum]
MSISSRLDQLHAEARGNRWLHYFANFTRLALAFGFITSGTVKIIGERFASGLSVNHPMGQYLEALHHTGFYYTFIGYAQVLAAILLLFRRTVLLGALIYFPIILNICILSHAVRFEGSILTSPLMVLASLFLICWNYDKLKHILPFGAPGTNPPPKQSELSNKFPARFFAGVVATVAVIILFIQFGFDIMPRNSSKDCMTQFENTNRTTAGAQFCDCIHNQGQPLDTCLVEYYQTPDDVVDSK